MDKVVFAGLRSVTLEWLCSLTAPLAVAVASDPPLCGTVRTLHQMCSQGVPEHMLPSTSISHRCHPSDPVTATAAADKTATSRQTRHVHPMPQYRRPPTFMWCCKQLRHVYVDMYTICTGIINTHIVTRHLHQHIHNTHAQETHPAAPRTSQTGVIWIQHQDSKGQARRWVTRQDMLNSNPSHTGSHINQCAM
jgi:hypothetical protein